MGLGLNQCQCELCEKAANYKKCRNAAVLIGLLTIPAIICCCVKKKSEKECQSKE